MPKIVTGNTNAAAIMIGEKGADIVRSYWAQQSSVCDLKEEIFLKLGRNLRRCFYAKYV